MAESQNLESLSWEYKPNNTYNPKHDLTVKIMNGTMVMTFFVKGFSSIKKKIKKKITTRERQHFFVAFGPLDFLLSTSVQSVVYLVGSIHSYSAVNETLMF